MKNSQLLIIIIILIQHSSIVCQDIRPYQDGFIISREFAEIIALKFDSLKFYKVQNENLLEAADTCNALINFASQINVMQAQKNILLVEQTQIQSRIINSYTITESLNLGLTKQLRKETRIKKGWKAAAISGLSLFTVSLVWIAIQ